MNTRNSLIIAILLVAVAVVGLSLFNNYRRETTPGDLVLAPGEQEGVMDSVSDFFTSRGSNFDLYDMNVVSTDLLEVVGGEAKGKAYVLRSNQDLMLYVKAQLPAPSNGKFYVVWLNNDASEYITAGRLEEVGDNDYELNYQTSEPLTSYQRVIISVENTETEVPTTRVLQNDLVK